MKAKKDSVWRKEGKFDCEVCGFNFFERYALPWEFFIKREREKERREKGRVPAVVY